jgi:hypothetical protein
MSNSIYSKSSSLSASVQKRRTLYLAKSDPRANEGFINKYRNDYYAEVVVLEDSEYLHLLASQIGTANITDVVDTYNNANILVDPATTLHPPTLLYWDYKNDPDATMFVTNNGANKVNVKITFDSSDILIDGVEYEPVVSSVKAGAASTSGDSTSSKTADPIELSSIHFSHYYSGMIEVRWKGLTDAIGYIVSLTGNNCPPRAVSQKSTSANTGTTKKRIYNLNYDPTHPSVNFPSPGYLNLDSSGYATIKLIPTSGSFSGSYTMTFVANYTDGVSKIARKATFTIGGGVPIIV